MALGSGATGLVLLASGCAPPPKLVAPPPAAVAPVAEAPAPPVDWRDLPISPGRWTYLPGNGAPSAQFARPAAAADFTISCDRTKKVLILFRAGRGTGPMTITTSYSGLSFPTQTASDGQSVTLPATSDFLDRIAFSRGHVTIALAGLPLLVLPTWAEPARVIEDCRA